MNNAKGDGKKLIQDFDQGAQTLKSRQWWKLTLKFTKNPNLGCSGPDFDKIPAVSWYRILVRGPDLISRKWHS